MAAQTHGPKDVARAVSKATGRNVDAKRVRAWVRDNVPAFDDDGYTAHVYDARTFAAIVKGMTATRRTDRSAAAQTGRKTSSPKRTKRPAPAPSVTPDEPSES